MVPHGDGVRLRPDPPLERDGELAVLGALLERAMAGRGGVVGVEAPAGMGKTTVLRSFGDLVTESAARLLRATGQELERDLPYATVRHLLEPALAHPGVRAEVLVGAAEPVGAWFAPATATEPIAPLTMLRALYWTVAGLAATRPLVLVVDDVPEADPASVQFLAHLCHGLAELPVLLVLAGRPEGWQAGAAPLAGLLDERIVLHPLSEAATAQLAERRLGVVPEHAFAETCREVAGGNPFYLGELLREVAGIGMDPTASNATWVADLGVPALVRGSLLRVASLPAGTVDLLRAAAVLGEGAQLATCARLAGLDARTAATIADRLADAGIMRRGRGLGFVHAILHTAVLADLPDHQRADLHRRAAETLRGLGAEDHVVVRHLLRSEPLHEPWAAEVLVREGRRLLASGDTAPAAEVLGAALAERPEAADAELYADLGTAAGLSGDPGGAEHLERALQLTTDPEELALRALRLSHFRSREGRNAVAIRVLNEVTSVLPPDSEPGLLARALKFLYGRYAAELHADTVGERPALEAMVEGPLTPGRAALRAVLASDASQHLPRDHAVALVLPAVGETLVEVAPLTTAPIFVALETLLTLELDAEFDALVELAVADSMRRGSALDLVACEHFRALAAHLRGLPVDAEDEASTSLASGIWSGLPVIASASYAIASIGALENGREADAAAALEQAEATVGWFGKPGALVHLARGRLQQSRGDTAAARASYDAAGDLLRPTHSLAPGLLDWAEPAVAARLAAGDREAAESLAAEQVALARVVSGPRALARSLRAAASCHPDEALLQEALDLLEGVGDRGVERVRALGQLGSLERRLGRPAVARRHLDEAWDLAQRIGAVGLAAQVRDELRVAGGRPRRGYVRGPESLTASERRVATLAAGGRSNVEIAQELFVTTKTVEKHLGATYRKLDVSSRRELATAMDGPS